MATELYKLDCKGTEGKGWDGLSPEVLDMIFKHLPVADLLSCSEVSKYWKKASRDVLKRSKECYAYVIYFHQDFQELNEAILSTDLMQMVNGLHIRNEVTENYESDSTASQFDWSEETKPELKKLKQQLHQAVLSSQWKYLYLDLKCPSEDALATEDISLLRELVSAASHSLEKLTIGEDGDWNCIMASLMKNFPKLKVVQALTTQDLTIPCAAYFLTNCAPKLEEITGAVLELQVHQPMDPFMLKRLKSICVCAETRVPEGKSLEAFQLVSGLHRLDLQHYHYDCDDEEYSDHDLEKWNSFVFPFVLRSLNTLVELRMYTMELYNLLATTEELKFPNLQRLSLASHWHVSLENEMLALEQLNIPKMCPSLKQLELCHVEASYTDVEQVVSPLGLSGEVNKSHSPLMIELQCQDRDHGMYRHEYLNFFKEIYPKIYKLRILNWGQDDCNEISKIFADLHSLQYLEITRFGSSKDLHFHVDALLRGITIEEAKLVSKFYGRKTAKWNACIVPIRPSLYNAKNLQELKITQNAPRDAVSHSWVTQITENLPIRHMRNLKVTFEGSVELYNELNRLRALPPCCPCAGMPVIRTGASSQD